MPKVSTQRKITHSPADMALNMAENILSQPKISVQEKLDNLRELALERIAFDSPDQATRIITAIANIIYSDPSAEVRVAALEAMERMIELEHRAEAEHGASPLNWRQIDLMLQKAKKATALDTVPVASRATVPTPEAPSLQVEKTAAAKVSKAVIGFAEDKPEAHPVSRDDVKLTPAEEKILSVQQKAVNAVKEENLSLIAPSTEQLAAGPSSGTESPQPISDKGAKLAEPPIMQFLRCIADTDDDDNIRKLAAKIAAKVEGMLPQQAPAPSVAAQPTPSEG